MFGIEVDNDIPGRYESFLDPTEKLKAIRDVAEAAHEVGNYAFVYIAGTECITAHGDQGCAHAGEGSSGLAPGEDHRRARDLWRRLRILDCEGRRRCLGQPVRRRVAQDLHGARAADCGDGNRRHLYRHSVLDDALRRLGRHLGQLRRLHRAARSRSKTGLDAKHDLKLGDFSDPNFRKWVDFRIQTFTDFLRRLTNGEGSQSKIKTIRRFIRGSRKKRSGLGRMFTACTGWWT